MSADIDLPLFNWQLENKSASIKVGFEEVDDPTTVVSSESRSATYAKNFGIDAGIDLFKILKLGVKFGSSNTLTTTSSVQTSTTLGSDDLYEAVVNFGDKVVTTQNLPGTKEQRFGDYETQEYTTGWCTFSIEPKKYQ